MKTKSFKYDWNKIDEHIKQDNLTMREITTLFNCTLSALQSAIRKGYINRMYIKYHPKVTEESKKKISEAMKRAHSEGRHSGWSFINKDTNRRSYPEKFFNKGITNNIFFKQFTIIEKMPFSKYFLDFAIIEKKVDIEIDGSQHFSTDEAIEHDKIRDNFLNDNGWTVYRITWKQLSANPSKEIDDLIKFLKQDFLYNRNYTIDEVKSYFTQKNKCICGSEKYKKSKFCNTCSRAQKRKFNPTKDELQQMINEMPITKIAKKYHVSDVAVHKRIELYNIKKLSRGTWLKNNIPMV